MEFAFTEEQEMIRDTAAAFLVSQSDSAAIRRAMVTESGYDPELWRRICNEMYWQAIHIPEQYGGMGLGYVELVATSSTSPATSVRRRSPRRSGDDGADGPLPAVFAFLRHGLPRR